MNAFNRILYSEIERNLPQLTKNEIHRRLTSLLFYLDYDMDTIFSYETLQTIKEAVEDLQMSKELKEMLAIRLENYSDFIHKIFDTVTPMTKFLTETSQIMRSDKHIKRYPNSWIKLKLETNSNNIEILKLIDSFLQEKSLEKGEAMLSASQDNFKNVNEAFYKLEIESEEDRATLSKILKDLGYSLTQAEVLLLLRLY